MNHEFRESPYTAGICAGCGQQWRACLGFKSAPKVGRRATDAPAAYAVLKVLAFSRTAREVATLERWFSL